MHPPRDLQVSIFSITPRVIRRFIITITPTFVGCTRQCGRAECKCTLNRRKNSALLEIQGTWLSVLDSSLQSSGVANCLGSHKRTQLGPSIGGSNRVSSVLLDIQNNNGNVAWRIHMCRSRVCKVDKQVSGQNTILEEICQHAAKLPIPDMRL